jgi:tetratricopeptide (TPR) repeat protein
MSLDLAADLQRRAWTLQEEYRFDEAAALLREAIDAASTCGEEGALDVANLLNDLAEIEFERGDIAASLDTARLAHAAADRDRASIDETGARIRLRSLERSATAARALGHFGDAERDLRDALQVADTMFGRTSFEWAQIANSLGMVYKYSGRWDEAGQLYAEVLRTVSATDGESADALASVYHNIGGLLHARGDYAGAEPPARKAWRLSRETRGSDDIQTMVHAVAYAAVLDGLDRWDESIPIYRQALTIFERLYGPDHPEVGATLHNLGAVLAATGSHDEAEDCYRRALTVAERTIGTDAPATALTRQNLGQLLCTVGRREEGLLLLESAIRAFEVCLPASHPYIAAARKNVEQAR